MKRPPVWLLVLAIVISALAVWLPQTTSADQLPAQRFQTSPLPTNTPVPPPSPTPPPACPDALVNGGFETNDGWYFPVTAHTAGYSTAVVHGGLRSMLNGIVAPPDRYSYSDGDQKVYIPTYAQSAVLHFWWYPRSAEPPTAGPDQLPSLKILQGLADHTLAPGTLAGDRQYVLLLDAHGNIMTQLLWTRSNAQAWQEQSLPLPAGIAGRKVTLVFGVYNDGNGKSTAMYIDDASLLVCGSQPVPTPTVPPTPPPGPNPTGARMYLTAPPATLAGQVFSMDIVAELGVSKADTVDAYLNFNPTYLEVVNAAGQPATGIVPKTAFPSVTYNAVNNTAGTINFSASTLGQAPITGTVSVATIYFRGKAAVTNTPLTWVRSSPRISDLLLAGGSLNPTLLNAAITIQPPYTLNGQLSLEARGPAGTSRWVTPLYRTEGVSTTNGINVFAQGGTTPLASYASTTNANGTFSVALPGISPGTYDISVKGANTLSNMRMNVNVPPLAIVNFGTLKVGDSDGNDAVNGADVSYMVPAFLSVKGDARFLPYADTNADGAINGADVSALVPNYLLAGPLPVLDSAEATGLAAAEAEAATGAALTLSPNPRLAGVGEVVAMDVVADAGTGSVDTADIYIDYDPNYLEVVDAAGNPASSIVPNPAAFSSVNYNQADNAVGHLGFSATRFQAPFLTGRFAVARIYFKVLAEAASVPVRFALGSENRARTSSLLQAGQSLRPAITDGNIMIGAFLHQYLPALQR